MGVLMASSRFTMTNTARGGRRNTKAARLPSSTQKPHITASSRYRPYLVYPPEGKMPFKVV